MLRKLIPSLNSVRFYSKAQQLVAVGEVEKQEFFLDSENCIAVDENDVNTGKISKRNCHKLDENSNIKLHRAFSVFLFNKQGEMLLQKRSNHKVSEITMKVVNKDESMTSDEQCGTI